MSLTIRPLNTGFVTTIPKQYLFHHSVHPYIKGIEDHRIEMPAFTFLIEGGDKLCLIDSGMSPTERAGTWHHPGSHQPEGMAIRDRLAEHGYTPADVDILVLTHLHWDHSYYLHEFTNATIYVHQVEHDFALDPIPMYYKSYESPELGITSHLAGVDFTTFVGSIEVMNGVRTLETPGHSPGHISVEIDTAAGMYICCGDSVFCPENLLPVPELKYDITPPGRFVDAIDTWRSIELQRDRVADNSFILGSHFRPLLQRVAETPVLGL